MKVPGFAIKTLKFPNISDGGKKSASIHEQKMLFATFSNHIDYYPDHIICNEKYCI